MAQGPKGHKAQRGTRPKGAQGPKGHKAQRGTRPKGAQGPKGHKAQRAIKLPYVIDLEHPVHQS
jgi:hypothetical protein